MKRIIYNDATLGFYTPYHRPRNGEVKRAGEKIALSLKGGKLVLNGSSRVIVADLKASNGIVHAIDAVLVPPSAA